ncbi:MAG: cell division protein FtsW [Anaerolineae bacterium]|nr:cell division protein FtsW [Anaerolineae bacterium]
MAQNVAPEFTDDLDAAASTRAAPRIVQPARTVASEPMDAKRPAVRKRGFLATLDTPLVITYVLLLAIGAMMVYSTTFDWAYSDFGSETAILIQHIRNMVIGVVLLVLFALFDYRIWKRFAVVALLLTVGALIAVLAFSDQLWGARRSLLNGSYQPGEMAELVVVVYMAAWLSSKNRKVQSFLNGLVPFIILLGIVGGLIVLQPDLSTAVTIFMVASIMYFLAGANIYYLGGVFALLVVAAYVVYNMFDYAQGRVSGFTSSLTDLSQASYHAQQAIIAFINGGWTGVGLGLGTQKFGFLPAPHTDSIFAVIGEELGVLGAAFVVFLFIMLAFRGFTIARRSVDPFGMLLAGGITLWIVIKALLNIAVMLSLIPPTGVALPFISFGGSSLVVVMAGAGLLLSVARVSARQSIPEGRSSGATDDRGWGNRWTRLSSPRSGGGSA